MRRTPRRRRPLEQPDNNDPRVNDRIRVPRVLVIDEEGNKLGEFLTHDAILLAEERGMDLIEVAPTARPPVCKIGDWGKVKYEKKKKAAVARRNQVQVQIKEIKLRPKTDTHDLTVKVNHARRFLEEGNKVKVTVRFRGRELAHRDIGALRCVQFAELLKDLSAVEAEPRMEGRQMFMILTPTQKPKIRRPTDPDLPDLPDLDDLDDDSDELDDDSDEVTGEEEVV